MPYSNSDSDYDEHGHDCRSRSPEEEDWLKTAEPELWAVLSGHRVGRVVPVTREDFLQGVEEPDEKDVPF